VHVSVPSTLFRGHVIENRVKYCNSTLLP
jgi:hypothetical protein